MHFKNNFKLNCSVLTKKTIVGKSIRVYQIDNTFDIIKLRKYNQALGQSFSDYYFFLSRHIHNKSGNRGVLNNQAK